ncbi:response regulator transcription factor [Novosphingobium sp. KCTC 2891]|uniref:LuxR C-terminal-related transcriptional regulator n=1 Tax=Novosphingobium sp. KCTC 2891 TaxID=2989730 RepID=UPI00222159EC|nr:response regulator transcription factor [Novosphingobium sp. KCTC 2891]MCW1381894.1 response regulator transcription factor [Novosphingobium sp. KCTC 2891]
MTAFAAEISVFIVGHNNLAREGLRRILEEQNFRVLASHDSYQSFADWPKDVASPHIIIFDTGNGDDIDIDMEHFRAEYPAARTIILADDFDFDRMMHAFETGACGFIVKEIACQPLMESLKLVAMGEKVMPSALAQFLPGRINASPRQTARESKLTQSLSEREVETFRRMCRGEPNKVIAQNLGISEATVKVHVKAILRKLHLHNRTQAVAWALNSGFDLNTPEASPARLTGGLSNRSPGAPPRLFAA